MENAFYKVITDFKEQKLEYPKINDTTQSVGDTSVNQSHKADKKFPRKMIGNSQKSQKRSKRHCSVFSSVKLTFLTSFLLSSHLYSNHSALTYSYGTSNSKLNN